VTKKLQEVTVHEVARLILDPLDQRPEVIAPGELNRASTIATEQHVVVPRRGQHVTVTAILAVYATHQVEAQK